MNTHSPIVSEVETPEQAAAYEAWLNAKVAGSLTDPRPPIPHHQVMAHARAIIAERRPKAC